ncbi:MAG TPA: hydrolase [Candidatus Obscuribacterales bacterium]
MRHPRILSAESAVLLIVDVQENFRKHLPDVSNLARNISILIEASKILNVPVFVTEQYPQGLGKTLAEIKACLGDHEYFEKSCFSCCDAQGFLDKLSVLERKQIMVSGIEAHVCVNQTVHGLLEAGYTVHVINDAIASRSARNKEIGWEKMIGSGAVPSCVEMALFEMLYESGTDTFKAVQRLIK